MIGGSGARYWGTGTGIETTFRRIVFLARFGVP